MVALKSEISNLKSDFSNLKSEISNLKFLSPRRPPPRTRAGFTFMEILFAVIIMGVGMIMVAAMFPAAIKQTQANVEDGASVTVSRSAINVMAQLGRQKQVPAPAPPIPDGLMDQWMRPLKSNPVPTPPKIPDPGA